MQQTVAGLLKRIKSAPALHLGERDPRTLNAYLFGYDAGLYHHNIEPVLDEVGDNMDDWVDGLLEFRPEHQGRLNSRAPVGPETYALLRAADPAEALTVYIDLWFEVCAKFPAQLRPWDSGWVRRSPNASSVIDQLLKIRERDRLGMYFGDNSVGNIWAFTSGFLWAEKDNDLASIGTGQLATFQRWIDARYPFSGETWARTFRFLAVNVWVVEGDLFFQHLNMFLAGEEASASDPVMEALKDAIIRKAGSTPEPD